MASASLQNRDLQSRSVYSKSLLTGRKPTLSSSTTLTQSKFTSIGLKSSLLPVSKPVLNTTSTLSALSTKRATNPDSPFAKKDALKRDTTASRESILKQPVLSSQTKQPVLSTQTSVTLRPTLTQKDSVSSVSNKQTQVSQTILLPSSNKTTLAGNLHSKISLSSGTIGLKTTTRRDPVGSGLVSTSNSGILGGSVGLPDTKGVGLTSTFQASVSSKSSSLIGSASVNRTLLTSGTTSTTKRTGISSVSPLTQKTSTLSTKSAMGSTSVIHATSTIAVKPQKPVAAIPLAKSSLLFKTNAGKLFQSSTTGSEKTKISPAMIKPKQETYLKQNLVVSTKEEGMPEYEFGSSSSKIEHELGFVPPELDASVQQPTKAPMDTERVKVTLINAVATSLLQSPDYKNRKDPSTKHLTKLGNKVSHHDPEFILKLALYTRKELNIRTTANFLLALAANISFCRPFLKKYFNASVNLPSDWIEIAEIYQAFHDKSINFGSLPTALRKVMSTKFKTFDEYQLAKYNKDTSKKKKKKAKPGKAKQGKPTATQFRSAPSQHPKIKNLPSKSQSDSDSDSDSEDSDDTLVASDSESEEEMERLTFTLKQLIRKLHIADPVEHVM